MGNRAIFFASCPPAKVRALRENDSGSQPAPTCSSTHFPRMNFGRCLNQSREMLLDNSLFLYWKMMVREPIHFHSMVTERTQPPANCVDIASCGNLIVAFWRKNVCTCCQTVILNVSMMNSQISNYNINSFSKWLFRNLDIFLHRLYSYS